MAFKDEGTPRWETCHASTGIDADTDEFLLVEGDRTAGAKYATVQLANATAEIIKGVTAGVDTEETMDPYDLATSRKIRVKTSKKLRCRTATAYVVANYGQVVQPDDTSGQEGWGVAHATVGQGRIVDGETIDSVHYLDFFLDESS